MFKRDRRRKNDRSAMRDTTKGKASPRETENPAVAEAVKKLSALRIDEQEILRRRDMRGAFTFTIDPADAKDFDDALSFEKTGDGLYQVGVHIADVSHYVQPDDEIDRQAYARGTSTYLVDRVIPMLPETLCNGLCSLRPNEDKLCMSVIFTMNDDAEVVKYKICRTVIRSDYRLNYDEAQEIIDKQAKSPTPNKPHPLPPPPKGGESVEGQALGKPNSLNISNIEEAIGELDRLARILRGKRFEAGALVLEQDEMRFRLDDQGEPEEIYFEHPNEAHHLIEEFMLLANRTVAEAVGKKAFVYRIHDKPDKDKMRELKQFKKRMGNKVQPQVLDILTVRAMAKAKYSTHNIGHYGLAFKYYTHFTSPIRRYPDLLVHRLLDKYLLRGKGESLPRTVLEDMCEHCSAKEIDAQTAERDSIKQYQAMWISKHIGEEGNGHISGVTDFGIFVQLDDSRCEGLVRINHLVPGDYMVYDEKNYRLIAEESGKTFTLGDAVRVKIVRADAEKRQIDFALVSEDSATRTRRGRRKSLR